MARSLQIKVEGLDKVKKMFSDVGHELKGKQLGSFLQAQGRAIVKVARTRVKYTGEIKRLFKKDLGVSRVKGMADNPYVTAGVRFIEIVDGREKVAVVAQHMTEGFKQTNRTGKKIGGNARSRGKVKNQVINPVIEGLNGSAQEREAANQKEFKRKINSIKRKYSKLVR
jgi:hypothetical protein